MKKSRQIFERPDNGTYCPNCKHFVWCDWGKIYATALSSYPCEDFEADIKGEQDAK